MVTESKHNFPHLLVQVLLILNPGEVVTGTFCKTPKCQDRNKIREKVWTVGNYLLDPWTSCILETTKSIKHNHSKATYY